MRLPEFFVLGTVFLMAGCATVSNQTIKDRDTYFSSANFRVFFANRLNDKNQPSEDLKSIHLPQDRIYIYIKWFGIPNGKYQYKCEIFDGNGNKITETHSTVVVDTNFRNTWTWHEINSAIDVPGTWKFIISIDGKPVLERSIEVVNEEVLQEK